MGESAGGLEWHALDGDELAIDGDGVAAIGDHGIDAVGSKHFKCIRLQTPCRKRDEMAVLAQLVECGACGSGDGVKRARAQGSVVIEKAVSASHGVPSRGVIRIFRRRHARVNLLECHALRCGPLAQLVEQGTFNPKV